MRFSNLTSTVALFAAADAPTGLTGVTSPTSNVAPATKPASKPARKLSGKAVTKPAKADKPAKPAKAVAAPTADDRQHGFNSNYTGASPVFRQHGRTLSPIVLNRVPNSFTDRDGALLKSLYAHFAGKPFQRRDLDAGAVSRLIGHGYVAHHSGMLNDRYAEFKLSAAGLKRCTPVSAKPAKA